MALCQKWNELDLDESPRYKLAAEELAEYARQWNDFQDAINLRNGVTQELNTNEEGWIPMDNCEIAMEGGCDRAIGAMVSHSTG